MATLRLISTGEITKRTGASMSMIHRLITRGVVPEPIVLEGSGRFVWKLEDYPAIERAIVTYRDRHKQRDVVAA